MLKRFKPNSINIIAAIVTLGIIYFLEIAFSCTGLYHIVDGTPTTPFSASEIPLTCIGNHISKNAWIYPIAAITSYAIMSLLIAHKKLKTKYI